MGVNMWSSFEIFALKYFHWDLPFNGSSSKDSMSLMDLIMCSLGVKLIGGGLKET